MLSRSHYRALACAAVLATFAIGWSQENDRKITLNAGVTTIRNLMPLLQQASGVTFGVGTSTADEVVYVDVRDVSLSEVMNRLAEAVGAAWERDSAGYRLVYPSELVKKQDREYLAFRTERILEELQAQSIRLSLEPKLDSDLVRAEMLRRQESERAIREAIRNQQPPPFNAAQASGRSVLEPAHRALIRALRAMGGDMLAALAEGRREVYALTPTRVQKKLPTSMKNVIEQFIAENNEFAELYGESRESEAESDSVIVIGGQSPRRKITGPLSEVHLILERGIRESDIRARIRFFDGEGNAIAQAFQQLEIAEDLRVRTEPEGLSTTPIAVSDLAKEHAALLSTSTGASQRMAFVTTSQGQMATLTVSGDSDSGERLNLSDELKALLRQPATRDPLSFAVAELLAAMNPERKLQFVACLPDRVLFDLNQRAIQGTNLQDVYRILVRFHTMDVTISDGWLTVRPKYPSKDRFWRVDRKALQSLIASTVSNGHASLDALGTYATGAPQPASSRSIESAYLRGINRQAGQAFSQVIPNWNMLKLYHSLGTARIRALAQGAPLQLSSLTASQMALVTQMTYHEARGPAFERPRQQPPGGPGATEYVVRSVTAVALGPGMAFETVGGGLLDERTEFLPNGVPRDGILTLNWTEEPAVLAASSQDPEGGRFYSAGEFGMLSGMLGAGNSPISSMTPNYDRFKPSRVTQLAFTFRYSPNASLTRQLSDATTVPGAQFGTLGQMPAEFRRRVEQFQRMGGAALGVERRGPPPPPSS